MKGLPPELAPWRPLLAPLSPEFPRHLGPWVRRLAAVLGPMTVDHEDPAGEPDGFGGVARRGGYERLLLSEWALARSVPLEFLRRAVMGEHLFLDPARRVRRGDPRLVALFDAGPDQLGAPRLAHLVALVVLAERAARAGGEFVWGLLQDPHAVRHDAADPDGFRHLLAGRSPRLPAAADLERWSGELGAVVADEERWWIGGATLAALRHDGGHGHGGRLTVSEPATPETAELMVAVSAPGRSRVELRLSLPPSPVRVRLLRDPTRSAGSRATTAGPADLAGMVFNPDGVRLLGRDGEGDVVAFQVRSQGQARVRKFGIAADEKLVAASIQGRRWIAVTRHQNVLHAHGVGTPAWRRASGAARLTGTDEDGLPPRILKDDQAPTPCLWSSALGKLLWMDGEGAVFEVEPFGAGRPRRLFRRAHALVMLGEICAVVEEAGTATAAKPRSLAVLDRDGEFRSQLSLASRGPMEVHLGYSPRRVRFGGMPGLLLALRRTEDSWRLVHGDRDRVLRPGSTCRVVGVARGKDGEPGLLVLEADGRTIQHVGLRSSRVVVRAPAPVTEVAVAVRSPCVALRFAADAGDDDLWVVSLRDNQVSMRRRRTRRGR